MGREVYAETYANNQKEMNIPLKLVLSKGIYLLSVSSENEFFTDKLIVQ
jgi:hypothetical protein